MDVSKGEKVRQFIRAVVWLRVCSPYPSRLVRQLRFPCFFTPCLSIHDIPQDIPWGSGRYIDSMCCKIVPTPVAVYGCIRQRIVLDGPVRPTAVRIQLNLLRPDHAIRVAAIAGRALEEFVASWEDHSGVGVQTAVRAPTYTHHRTCHPSTTRRSAFALQRCFRAVAWIS